MTKRVTIILYGADRELWPGAKARLRVVDNNGPGSAREIHNTEFKPPTLAVDLELPFDAGQAYVVAIEAKDHRTAWQVISRQTFIRNEGGQEIEKAEAIFRLMLMPKGTKPLDLDQGFQRLQDTGSFLGRNWAPGLKFEKLIAAQQMALLNIEAKLRDTGVGTQRLAPFVTTVRRIDPDRVYVMVKAELKQLIERSRDFAGAPGHPDAKNGLPGHPDSWKRIVYGSGEVQLSFAKSTELGGSPKEPCYSVDVDIDLSRGLGHAWEYLTNQVFKPGNKTDQALVYGLLFSQGITPLYRLAP